MVMTNVADDRPLPQPGGRRELHALRRRERGLVEPVAEPRTRRARSRRCRVSSTVTSTRTVPSTPAAARLVDVLRLDLRRRLGLDGVFGAGIGGIGRLRRGAVHLLVADRPPPRLRGRRGVRARTSPAHGHGDAAASRCRRRARGRDRAAPPCGVRGRRAAACAADALVAGSGGGAAASGWASARGEALRLRGGGSSGFVPASFGFFCLGLASDDRDGSRCVGPAAGDAIPAATRRRDASHGAEARAGASATTRICVYFDGLDVDGELGDALDLGEIDDVHDVAVRHVLRRR